MQTEFGLAPHQPPILWFDSSDWDTPFAESVNAVSDGECAELQEHESKLQERHHTVAIEEGESEEGERHEQRHQGRRETDASE